MFILCGECEHGADVTIVGAGHDGLKFRLNGELPERCPLFDVARPDGWHCPEFDFAVAEAERLASPKG